MNRLVHCIPLLLALALAPSMARGQDVTNDPGTLGTPDDLLLPLTVRGYELNVVNGVTQPMTTTVEGHKVRLTLPVYIYLPAEQARQARRQSLTNIRNELSKLVIAPSVDSVKVMKLVGTLQSLIQDAPNDAAGAAALAPKIDTPSSVETANDSDGAVPKHIGHYTLHVLDRAKSVRVAVGATSRELRLPVYFYLPNYAAESAYVAGIRQVASLLAKLAQTERVAGDDLGIAILAIDRVQDTEVEFKQEHTLLTAKRFGAVEVTESQQ
jgi:hypothetical protein